MTIKNFGQSNFKTPTIEKVSIQFWTQFPEKNLLRERRTRLMRNFPFLGTDFCLMISIFPFLTNEWHASISFGQWWNSAENWPRKWNLHSDNKANTCQHLPRTSACDVETDVIFGCSLGHWRQTEWAWRTQCSATTRSRSLWFAADGFSRKILVWKSIQGSCPILRTTPGGLFCLCLKKWL